MSAAPKLPSVGLLEAVDDSRLLGAAFEPWPVQREWLRAIEAGPRLQVFAAGRRVGKTLVAAVAGVWCCLLRPELLDALRPGERGYAVAVGTNLRQSRLYVAAARTLVEASSMLGPMLESASEDELVFANGTALAAFPCGSRGARGWPVFALLLDEFAHHVFSDGNSAAEQVWRSLVPSTAQFGEAARVLVASTPAGSAGFFAELFRRAEAGELAGARAHRATSAEANPTLSADFLAAERLMLGEDVFAAEYGASFAAGGGLFFDPAEVRAVVGQREALPDEGSGWVAALDPSSGAGDAFACVVVGRDKRKGYGGRLLVAHVERWLPRRGGKASRRSRVERDLWLDVVLDGVAAIAGRYGATVVSDVHIPGVIEHELAKRGVRGVRVRPWSTTTRTSAFQTLRARIGTERIELPDDAALISELLRIRTRFRGGAATIDVGRVGDSHGDLAVALALGVTELDASGVTRSRARIGRPSGVLGGSFGGGDADRLAEIFRIPSESIVDASRRGSR